MKAEKSDRFNWRFLLIALPLGFLVSLVLWWAIIAHFGPTVGILGMMALICYVLVKY
jgi:hypothetical protein